MLSGSELSFTEISRQLGVRRSTLYRHLHASGWEREAPGRTERLCCKPDVGVSQIRTTTVLSSCFCVGQTVL